MFKPTKNLEKVKESSIRKMFDKTKPGDISFGLGQPFHEPPDYVKEAMKKAICKSPYTQTMGKEELREAIAEYWQEKGADVKKENVIITCGASEALYDFCNAFIEKGNKVAISRPSFLLYKQQIESRGAKIIYFDLGKDFIFDYEKFYETIENEKPNYIILNFPSNPTGRTIKRKELEEIVETCEQRGIGIVSDEVYREFWYEEPHVSLLEVADLNNSIFIDSFSKIFGLCGERLGYAITSKKNMKHMRKAHQITVACAPRYVQFGVLEAYKRKDETEKYLDNLRREYRKRRDKMVNGLNKIGIDCYMPEGAFYVFPSVEKFGMSGDEFAIKALDHGVIVVSGKDFGRFDCIRISYATSLENIEKGLYRLNEFLESSGCK